MVTDSESEDEMPTLDLSGHPNAPPREITVKWTQFQADAMDGLLEAGCVDELAVYLMDGYDRSDELTSDFISFLKSEIEERFFDINPEYRLGQLIRLMEQRLGQAPKISNKAGSSVDHAKQGEAKKKSLLDHMKKQIEPLTNIYKIYAKYKTEGFNRVDGPRRTGETQQDN